MADLYPKDVQQEGACRSFERKIGIAVFFYDGYVEFWPSGSFSGSRKRVLWS